MGRFLARLDGLEKQLRTSEPHPLVGPPTLHAAMLHGGTGASTYAAHCKLTIERRMTPSETEALVVGQLREIVDELAAEDPTFRAEVHATLTRGGFEVSPDAPIVRTVLDMAAEVTGERPRTRGFGFWMDAAFLAEAGIETVVFGARGEGAHADVEWADVESHVQLADILARAAVAYCGG